MTNKLPTLDDVKMSPAIGHGEPIRFEAGKGPLAGCLFVKHPLQRPRHCKSSLMIRLGKNPQNKGMVIMDIMAGRERKWIYEPYDFDGDWSESEKQTIKDEIDKHVPPHFNGWSFGKQAGGTWRNYYAVRAAWDLAQMNAKSPKELAKKIKAYYAT